MGMTRAAASLRDPAVQARIADFVARAAGARSARVTEARPLAGGAIQENWALDLEIEGGKFAGRQPVVLRTDASSGVAVSLTRAQEFRLLQLARAAGVTVPEPLWLCDDRGVIGRSFYLMRRVCGIAAGHRVVKDPGVASRRETLAERLGRELARIHAITPARVPSLLPDAAAEDFAFLHYPAPTPALDHVARYRAELDKRAEAHPVLEYALRRLELAAPPAGEILLVHQDFRTGNYMVDDGRLTAILDWEFCAWGEPMADIGWFCAKCWRFGAGEEAPGDRDAGGVAPRGAFYRGYEAESGRRIDPVAVRYWEIMAHVRWAVIALQQADRHVLGGEASLNLALTGRLLPELELYLLDLLDGREAA